MEAPWRLARGQKLDARVWDEEAVVYNDLSGATHLVDAVALHLLRTLQAASATEAALAHAVRAEFDTDADDAVEAHVAATLLALTKLALVEPCP